MRINISITIVKWNSNKINFESNEIVFDWNILFGLMGTVANKEKLELEQSHSLFEKKVQTHTKHINSKQL